MGLDKKCFCRVSEIEKNIIMVYLVGHIEVKVEHINEIIFSSENFNQNYVSYIFSINKDQAFSFGAIQFLASLDNILSLSFISKERSTVAYTIKDFLHVLNAHYPVKIFEDLSSSLNWSRGVQAYF